MGAGTGHEAGAAPVVQGAEHDSRHCSLLMCTGLCRFNCLCQNGSAQTRDALYRWLGLVQSRAGTGGAAVRAERSRRRRGKAHLAHYKWQQSHRHCQVCFPTGSASQEEAFHFAEQVFCLSRYKAANARSRMPTNLRMWRT